MQGIRQTVFNRPAALLPVLGVFQPVIAIGDISPCANMGKARRQRIKVAFHAVATPDLLVHPRRRNDARIVAQKCENFTDQPAMLARHGFAKIRNLRDRP